jgi:MFS superfamily sulfate permease-like transporter
MKAPYFFHRSNHKDKNAIKIDLSQEVSFLNKASIKYTLDHLPENSQIIIDASHTVYIDYDVLEIIEEFSQVIAPQKNIKVTLIGFKNEYKMSNTDHVLDVENFFEKPKMGEPADTLLGEMVKK